MDGKNLQQSLDQFSELKHQYTVVLVIHNMQQAQRLSDKAAFMYRSELIIDTAGNNFKHPKKI